MTLKDEKLRLRRDYPHLEPVFEGGSGIWECHICRESRMCGLFIVSTGWGKTKSEALLEARRPVDHEAAEEARRAEEARLRAEEVAAREKALDDAVFDAIPLHQKSATLVG